MPRELPENRREGRRDPARSGRAGPRPLAACVLCNYTVFSDEAALLIDDPDHSQDEDRFIILGFSSAVRLLVVVHIHRESADTIRIISARKAIRAEQRHYARRRSP